MTNKKSIFLIFIFITTSYFSLRLGKYLNAQSKRYNQCVKEGGKMETVDYISGPSTVCIHYYSDGGKTCASNDDCEGYCLITKDTILEDTGNFFPKVVGGTGLCQEKEEKGGCSTPNFDYTVQVCE